MNRSLQYVTKRVKGRITVREVSMLHAVTFLRQVTQAGHCKTSPTEIPLFLKMVLH